MTTSRTRKIIYWLLPVLLIAGLAWGVVRALDKRATKAEQAQAAAQALQSAPVYEVSERDVVRARTVALQQTASVSGSIEALQTVAIKARVAGEVQGLAKREGDSVAAGEVLARIDPTEAQARVRQAEQQAESALAQVRIAQRSQTNNQALVQQGFISATALENSQANLAAAEATHRAAVAALDIALKGLGDTVLRSPIAGQIAARLTQNGERVGVDARVFDVVDLSAFEMEAALSPADAAAVQVGQTARLHRGLVRGTDLAAGASASATGLIAGTSMAVASARARAGADPGALEDALREQVERFIAQGPTPAELRRAQVQFEREWLSELSHLDARADQLGCYATLHDDPERVNRRTEEVARIGIDEVAEAARRFLPVSLAATLRYRREDDDAA